MTTNDDRLIDPFIDWLDAYVAGTSTLAAGAEADSDSDLTEIRAAARQFHGLDARLRQYAVAVSPSAPSWEDLMSAHPETLESFEAIDHPAAASTVSNVVTVRPWERAVNALLAAALILALAAGLWRAADNLGFGTGDEPPDEGSISFGSFLAQDDDGDIDPATLPTAEDCTVPQLTVDQVLAYVAAFIGGTSGPLNATPAATPAPPRPIARDDLEGIAATHRMWMACVLAGSYYQIWALEDPDYVVTQVLISIQLLNPEDQRAALVDLEANGPRENSVFLQFSQLGYPGPDRLHLIDDLSGNGVLDTRLARVGYASFSGDGTFLGRVSPAADGPNATMADSCNSYLFTWSDERSMWLIYDAPNCA